jgi:UPF0755 protein
MRFLLLRPVKRVLQAIFVLVAIFLVWFFLQMNPIGGSGKEAVFTVNPGDSVAQIASEMHDAGIIHSTFAFRINSLLFGAPLVRAGSYEIPQNSSFSYVKSVISNLPNVRVVNVLPGHTLREVERQIVSDAGNAFALTFSQAVNEQIALNPFHPNGSLEGLIGPGKYILTPSTTGKSLLKQMQTAFTDMANKAGFSTKTIIQGQNAYQLLIAASIVEKEGYYPSNMPKVARVIFNRLKRGGSLQMDSTVLYYLGKDGGRVTRAMLKQNNPYNTYLNAGLTPTPICVVSPAALNAVLHAPAGKWLYFTLVSKDGTEAFSETFAEQLANERLAASRGIK